MEKDKKEQNEKQSKEKDAAPSTSGSAKKVGNHRLQLKKVV